jgi:hypothetical protein
LEQERLRRIDEAERAKKERAERQAWEAKIAQVDRLTPEDKVVDESYPTLKLIAEIYRGVACIAGIVGIIGLLAIVGSDHILVEAKVIASVLIVVSVVVAILALILASESIELFLNMADDIRVSKALLKRVAYPPENQPPDSPAGGEQKGS